MCCMVESALAFYSPRSGRWLSRDPVEEPGAVRLQDSVSGDQGTVIPPTPDEQQHETQVATVLLNQVKQYSYGGTYSVPPRTEDPVRVDYVYADNSPPGRVDSLGLVSCCPGAFCLGASTPAYPTRTCSWIIGGTQICGGGGRCTCDKGCECTKVGILSCARCYTCRYVRVQWFPLPKWQWRWVFDPIKPQGGCI